MRNFIKYGKVLCMPSTTPRLTSFSKEVRLQHLFSNNFRSLSVIYAFYRINSVYIKGNNKGLKDK